VTLHEITAGVDEGPIIDQRRVPIDITDDWLVVRDRIAVATDELIATNLTRILEGAWSSVAQDAARASYGRRRKAEDGRFDWTMSVIDIHNQIRALLPPLPPAFHVDAAGERVPMAERLTPHALAGLKYGPVGKGVIQSEHVRLRALSQSDAELVYKCMKDHELVLLNSTFHSDSLLEHETEIESLWVERSDLVFFVIEERSTTTAIGTCALININWRHRHAKLQIRITDAARYREELGTQAVSLVCQFGFADLNLHRIYLHAFADNTLAITAYEKAGFSREGLLQDAAYIDGRYVDIASMRKIRRNE
jgi:RimJ/RimL family protein N-acetyltransferase